MSEQLPFTIEEAFDYLERGNIAEACLKINEDGIGVVWLFVEPTVVDGTPKQPCNYRNSYHEPRCTYPNGKKMWVLENPVDRLVAAMLDMVYARFTQFASMESSFEGWVTWYVADRRIGLRGEEMITRIEQIAEELWPKN